MLTPALSIHSFYIVWLGPGHTDFESACTWPTFFLVNTSLVSCIAAIVNSA